MRLLALAMSAALLVLGGCDPGSQQSGAASSALAANSAAASGAFDYRYAYRLPSGEIRAVEDSHAGGCDRLGPARCRITAMLYNVDDQSRVNATLTLKIDPTLARAFGKAAAATVQASGGALTSAEVAGADSLAASGRGDSAIERLRDALGNAEAQSREASSTPDQRAQANAKAERLRAAIATIGEVDQVAGTSVATTPVILTYTSGGVIPGVGASADASFDNAGATFLSSLAGLAVVLAGVGPWALLLLGGALALRWIIQSTDRGPAPDLPAASHDHAESRNVVQRWFGREEHHEPERTD
jgi:hypothetical protein